MVKAAAYSAPVNTNSQHRALTSTTGGKMVVLGFAFMVALTVVGAIQSLANPLTQLVNSLRNADDHEDGSVDETITPLLHK
jgi:hypothetical protein